MRLWHRFQIWRARRMYERVKRIEAEAAALLAKADLLVRRHAEDPQRRLPLGDD
jgi:hypothetical protein